ncbi:HlyD family secretion protein [Brumimicrobium aurantiacum]|uniref:HlyD family efflux transporter periplasmic adaptor subunit n=1 Tax=Brumimicrobium aurantiacum TaxID=1737063 RepID=A0A3E1EVH9_9FLAO|nr:HlyD family efflux transporter periplasmic adaptor subunit [Brumimicrobium aurantiacum]RFC53550.1 HlyD family efflux transporter periplasmic adaptor subunit [Brumimicrobium aurantiacum]
MLNISKTTISRKIDKAKFSSLKKTEGRLAHKILPRILISLLILFIIFLFVPWTQNIRATGKVNTLNPAQRPQMLNSVIPGRVEEWYVQEGEFVKKGDTILKISEVKSNYFDPELLDRAKEQVSAKEGAVEAYKEKVEALDNQANALKNMLQLRLEQGQNKLKQARLKVASDSIDLVAFKINQETAKQQLDRFEKLYDEGLKSKTDLENRNLKYQEALAKKVAVENKLLTSRNELINAKIELASIRTEYENTIAKVNADKSTAQSNQFDAEGQVAKLQNQYMNYSVRQGMYFVTAPQDGYVTQATTSGIGELIKEGQQIVSIMPADYQLAVEMLVRPLDLPLIKKGQPVRIQFDGWPALVFSGWPNTSYGTYAGEVFAIDNFANNQGLFRVLVIPDDDGYPWPDEIRVGGGANSMLLLNDVPVWYELWRQFNGFPPDYYKSQATKNKAGTSNQKAN